MSVETGISPRELLALDADMFDAVLQARRKRWTMELELLATAVELAHSHLILFVRAHSKKGARVPEPLRIERPGEDDEVAALTPTPVSVTELARLAGKDGG